MSVLGQVDRRTFLKAAALTAGAAAVQYKPCAEAAITARAGLVDINVNLSRWPLRSLRLDDTRELVAKLRRFGVAQAWAGSFDGLVHKDLAGVNARLSAECRKHGKGLLRPFGSVNPMLPDWEDDLRRCVEEHEMPGIRLHPNYHGYKLSDPAFARLLRLAEDRRLIVQLALVMEDERMMHPLFQVPAVDPSPLIHLLKETPELRLVLLNALRTLRGDALLQLLEAGEVYVEISMLEGVGGVENLLRQIPLSRLCFGSHAPLFYFESSLLKLKESALNQEQLRLIRWENARGLSPAAPAKS